MKTISWYKNRLLNINERVSYKREIFDICYEALIHSNLCLIGLRQAGKTTLMEQVASKYYQEVLKDKSTDENILYINLKNFLVEESQSKKKEELWLLLADPKYHLILIDEIQELSNWTDILQTAIDINYKAKFIVCASNSFALLKELMVGRMSYVYIDPLSYNEYKSIWEVKDNNIDEYLRYGSYPRALYNFNIQQQYQELISTIIIDKIVLSDLNRNVEPNKFKALLSNINNYIGNEIIYSDIEKQINITRQTAKEYILLMNQTKLVNLVSKYEDKNDKRKHKVYYEDKSMIYHFHDETELNNNLIGSLIENEVFMWLKRKYYYKVIDLNEICYFRNSSNKEIDFVLKREKLLVECKYVDDIDPFDLSLELNKTIKNNPEFDNYKKIVVTKNYYRDNVNGWDFIKLEDLIKDKIKLF